jgi:hypothetical protein
MLWVPLVEVARLRSTGATWPTGEAWAACVTAGVAGEDVAEIDGASVADGGDICAAILAADDAADDKSGSAAVGGVRAADGGKADDGCACATRSTVDGWWLDGTCDRSPG